MAGVSPTFKKTTWSIEDRNTGRAYLVDTGADLCLLPASPTDIHSKNRTDGIPTLWTATEGRVKVYIKREVALRFGSRTFNHVFVIANVAQNILGNSFFLDYNLGIDPKEIKLVDLGAGHGWSGITDTNPSKEARATVICSVSTVSSDGSAVADTASDQEFKETTPTISRDSEN